MHEHRHGDEPAPHHLAFDTPEAAAFAELDGEVLGGLTTQAISALGELCQRHGVEVRRVLDIGCGPGVGTCWLAQRFDAASVVAVDGSPNMLEHVKARARRLGLASRVQTRLVELPVGLSGLGRTDIAWASMVLHHVDDEAAALRRIRDLLDVGGLLAVVERAGPVRVLVDGAELGRPGLWERLDAAWEAWFTEMRTTLPGATTSADYPTMLEETSFELVADEELTLVLDPPLDAQARRFAHEDLLRTRAQLSAHADAADLEALDVLAGENADPGIPGRGDAGLWASRHLYVAQAEPHAKVVSG